MQDTHSDLPVAALAPATLGPRVAAGLLDLLALLLLSTVAIRASMTFLGGSLPIVLVVAAVVAWSVLPMWAFQATLSMRLFGIEVVARGGDRPDFVSLLVRELIGRGLFAVAYLGTFIIALVGAILGRTALALPLGLTALLSGLALLMLAIAAIGHLLALARTDRRGLADLLAGTVMVRRRAADLASVTDGLDEDELALVGGRTGVGGFLGMEVLTLALAAGIPYLMTVGLPSPDFHRESAGVQRMRLDEKTRRFDANPADRKIARALLVALQAEGLTDEADAVLTRHRDAVRKAGEKREALLRARLFAAPTDFETLGMLIELLED